MCFTLLLPPPCHREPLTIDVSVGKTDPIYKAHAYHTKVPHLAIVPSIRHTPGRGDVVLDAFAGSGMTGVVPQWCGCDPSVEFMTAGALAPPGCNNLAARQSWGKAAKRVRECQSDAKGVHHTRDDR